MYDLSKVVLTGTRWPEAGDAQRPVTEYQCCECQRHHADGLDPLYAAHLMSQSKHGMYLRPPTAGEVFARLVAE